MRLPADPVKRFGLYRDIIRDCEVSRERRRARHHRNVSWFLAGSDTGQPARYNAIRKLVDQSTGYLFAPEAARFAVVSPPQYGDRWIEEEEGAREELTRLWHDSTAGGTAATIVRWAHATPTMFAKVITDHNVPKLTMIPDPSDVGVWTEDIEDWDRQEVICHWFALSLPAYIRMVSSHHDKGYRDLLIAEGHEYAAAGGDAPSDFLPPTVQRLLIAQATPNMVGAVNDIAADTLLPIPQVRAPVVNLCEMWIWDDELDDYRVVKQNCTTLRILWDPANPLIAQEHPFHPLTLEPTPGNVWGIAPIESVIPMQALLDHRLQQIKRLMDLNLEPPLVGIGMTGNAEEMMENLRAPRGQMTLTPQPFQQDIKPMAPPMPPEAFADVQEMERMMAEAFGLPLPAAGLQQGVPRSGDQQFAQAALSAGPTLNRAMVVESWLAGVATQMLKLDRRVRSKTLTKDDGSAWVFSQMPNDFTVVVASHSHSPIYAAQIRDRLQLAKTWNAIENDDAIRMLGLPNEDTLARKARKLAKIQAERADEMMKLRERETRAKEIKAEASLRGKM